MLCFWQVYVRFEGQQHAILASEPLSFQAWRSRLSSHKKASRAASERRRLRSSPIVASIISGVLCYISIIYMCIATITIGRYNPTILKGSRLFGGIVCHWNTAARPVKCLKQASVCTARTTLSPCSGCTTSSAESSIGSSTVDTGFGFRIQYVWRPWIVDTSPHTPRPGHVWMDHEVREP